MATTMATLTRDSQLPLGLSIDYSVRRRRVN